MIKNGRIAASLEGNFVVFLIGMRINKPWLIHKWLPIAMKMPRLTKELQERPELGFLHAESWVGRTTISVQYWRSIEQLLAYSRNKECDHLPAWKRFNQSIGGNDSVGIWHETYIVSPNSYENIYVNMPAFGLGKCGEPYEPTGNKQSAQSRIKAT